MHKYLKHCYEKFFFSNMENQIHVNKRKPYFNIIFSIFFFLICTYHFLIRIGISPQPLILISIFFIFILLSREIQFIFYDVLKDPKKYIFIGCILISALGGIVITSSNYLEMGQFLSFFLLSFIIFKGKAEFLINSIVRLIICSGVIMSCGILIGLFEAFFLSSQHFYHFGGDYPSIMNEKYIFSGFGYNHNYSVHIILIALSFLFLSEVNISSKLQTFLALFFISAMMIASSRIIFLFFALVVCNLLFKNRNRKLLFCSLIIVFYLFFTHILIGLNGSYDLGSSHYREILFSIGKIDFVLGNYGYMKLVYFSELFENKFFPIPLSDITLLLNADPHSFLFSLIILGGLPLATFVILYLLSNILKNLPFVLENHSLIFYCGLISILVETVIYDASNSIFFWIIIFYSITASKERIQE